MRTERKIGTKSALPKTMAMASNTKEIFKQSWALLSNRNEGCNMIKYNDSVLTLKTPLNSLFIFIVLLLAVF